MEAFVGQELLAYSDPIAKEELFYWRKQERNSQAEVDYVVQLRDKVVPIKVKTGTSQRLQSLHMFLDSHLNAGYGIRFSAYNYAQSKKVYSYPLYAIVQPLFEVNEDLLNAVKRLTNAR